MIVYDLCCPGGHRFEGWFSSSQDYASQQERGLLTCPHCGMGDIAKAPMAPAVPKKGNQQTLPAEPASHPGREGESMPVASGPPPREVTEALEKLATLQAEALKESTWVGDGFAEQSRAMHYGEKDEKMIHGKATPDEAKQLQEEGIAVAPLLFPIAPPDELN